MLDFLKKNYEVIAPVSGKILDLSEVPDEIFSKKIAGDGAAIDVTGDIIVAPADGELTLVFKTCHAFALTFIFIFHFVITTLCFFSINYALLLNTVLY